MHGPINIKNSYTVDSSKKYEQGTHRCLSVAALKSWAVLTATCGAAIHTGRTVASWGQQFTNFYIADIDIISAKIQRTYFCLSKAKTVPRTRQSITFYVNILSCLPAFHSATPIIANTLYISSVVNERTKLRWTDTGRGRQIIQRENYPLLTPALF